jgi:hypothetical protein
MQKEAIGNFEYCAKLFDRAVTIDAGEEHILPEYMPTIAKVISCRATPSMPVRYISADNIEYAGAICYRLLYEGGDGGEIFCATLPGEYSVCIEMKKDMDIDTDTLCGLAEAYVESVSVRVSAPRKLNIKSKVKLNASLSGSERCECLLRGDEVGDGSLRVLEGQESGGRFMSGISDVLSLSETIRTDELGVSNGDALRIIESGGEMFINQVQYADGCAVVRGDVCACMLYLKDGEGERPRRYSRRIPFEVSCRLSGRLGERDRLVGLRAYGYIPSAKATVETDGVELSLEGLVSAEACAVTPISYPKDLYSLTNSSESSHRRITLRTPLAVFGANATISGSESVSKLGIESTDKVLDASVLSLSELVGTLEGGALVVSGKARVGLLVDDGLSLSCSEMDLPIRYTATLQADFEGGETEVSIISSVPECKVRSDGETVFVDAEVVMAVRVCALCNIEYANEANFTRLDDTGRKRRAVRVCYPSSDDTLWSVAKRYKLDFAPIAISNGLDTTLAPDNPGTLEGVRFLIL